MGSPAQIRALPPDVQGAVVEAFAEGVSSVFLWAVPFALVGLVLVILVPELPLRDTAHIGSNVPPADLKPAPQEGAAPAQ